MKAEDEKGKNWQRRMTINNSLIIFLATIAFASTLLYYQSYNQITPPCQLYYPPISPPPPLHDQNNGATPTHDDHVDTPQLLEEIKEISEDVRLERVLEGAAMENKTVIVTTLNAAWSKPGSMIDVFLESFKIGNGTQHLLDHLVIVAMDLEAYGRCKAIHRHCFALVSTDEGEDFSGDEHFMSPVYLKMMWRRTHFLKLILQKGYSFIFTDSDIMWFRSPFPQLDSVAEFQIACDDYNGDHNNINNYANGGFMYVKASNKTIAFYEYWYSMREKYPSTNEQDVLNFYMKYDWNVIKEIGVTPWFLDNDYFSDLCQPTKDLEKVCTMHSNCCLLGLDAKLHDLRIMLDDWRTYKEKVGGDSKKNGHRYSWSLLKMKCG